MMHHVDYETIAYWLHQAQRELVLEHGKRGEYNHAYTTADVLLRALKIANDEGNDGAEFSALSAISDAYDMLSADSIHTDD